MSRKILSALLISILLLAMPACNTNETATTPDTQATVDAAMAATATAQASIASAIEATSTALSAEDGTVTMSEEELNDIIDQSVTEALAAYEEACAYAEEAASDGNLTQEEIDTIYSYYDAAYDLIAMADEYMALYYDLYADLVNETIEILDTVNDELAAMEESMNEILGIVDTAAESIQQGQEIRQETLDQLSASMENYQQTAQEAADAWQTWEENWNETRSQRMQAIQDILPSAVPGSREESLEAVASYIKNVQNALDDYALSDEELRAIAQQGANAIAGLQKQGPALQNLAGHISEITDTLARGNTPNALTLLSNLTSAFSGIPGAPSLPNFNPPAPPSLPSHSGGRHRP